MMKSTDCIMDNAKRDMAALETCYNRAETAQREGLENWAVKYPAQAANLKRDALAAARKSDAEQMKSQPAKN